MEDGSQLWCCGSVSQTSALQGCSYSNKDNVFVRDKIFTRHASGSVHQSVGSPLWSWRKYLNAFWMDAMKCWVSTMWLFYIYIFIFVLIFLILYIYIHNIIKCLITQYIYIYIPLYIPIYIYPIYCIIYIYVYIYNIYIIGFSMKWCYRNTCSLQDEL